MESAGGGNAPSAEMEQSATQNQAFFSKHTSEYFHPILYSGVREM
jgi:hypothetical protein